MRYAHLAARADMKVLRPRLEAAAMAERQQRLYVAEQGNLDALEPY